MTNEYTDEELRVIFIPKAMELVNNEFYRTLNKCNTNTIAEVVQELINIVRSGKAAVDKEDRDTVEELPKRISKSKAPKQTEMKYK